MTGAEPVSGSVPSPRVYISYAHSSEAHNEQVRDLLDFLRANGVDTHIDMEVAEDRQNWTRWMVREITAADRILIVASPAYKQYAEAGSETATATGRGTQIEFRLIREELLRDMSAADRFLPVVLPGDSINDVPELFTTRTIYRIAEFTVAGAEALLRAIHQPPEEVEPAVTPGADSRVDLSSSAAGVLRGALAEARGSSVTLDHVLISALRRPPAGRNDVAAGLALSLDSDIDAVAAQLAAAFGLPEYHEIAVSDSELIHRPGVREAVAGGHAILTGLGYTGAVRLRHLLGAAFAAGPRSDILDALGVSAADLRERFIKVIHERMPSESSDAWRAVLAGRAEAAKIRRRVLAGGHTADLVDPERGIPLDRDDLGVATYVTMLASLIAHRDTPLPLSIGLFGQWGSGKSYFMGLLRQRVDDLASRGVADYHRDIVQIGFNAWTYPLCQDHLRQLHPSGSL